MDSLKLNKLGLSKEDYSGAPSTLCLGCGHDLLSTHIISACYGADISPYDLTKMSGIGCSSKTPAYFISTSFAFNSMHGRMASIATGAKLANIKLKLLGVSGDGDTANIGVGGFIHAIRRNLPICYLVANNGVYGLTKGQFSATADKNSPLKDGQTSPLETLDLCLLALESGCNFVARSFVGDPKQLVPLIQAALQHDGMAFIDVISPCVTFNNHEGSTKSYAHLKKHEKPFQTLQDRTEAIRCIHESYSKGEILTGLFYHNEQNSSMGERLNMTERSLSSLQEKDLRPSDDALKNILSQFK
jgi:2-oxoglutarate ferredoxin oxidoreductase subunit beta